MNLASFKSLISLIIFLAGLLSVLSPLRLVDDGSDSAFSVGNMAASGVLLAAGLTHQLADASSALDVRPDGYPWSMAIAGATFIAFLVLEETVHLLLGGGHDVGGGGDGGPAEDDDGGGGGTKLVRTDNQRSCRGSFVAAASSHREDKNSHGGHSHGASSHSHGGVTTRRSSALLPRKSSERHGSHSHRSSSHSHAHDDGGHDHSHDHSHNHSHGDSHDDSHGAPQKSEPLSESLRIESQPLLPRPDTSLGRRCVSDPDGRMSVVEIPSLLGGLLEAVREVQAGHHGDFARPSPAHHHHEDHLVQHLHGSPIAALVLLLALSLHSFLAGLSIGIVGAMSEITSTAIAILAHKVFAGYALGSTMASAEMERTRHVWLGAAFALSTPLGIFAGMALSGGAYDEDSAAVGSVQAVVAGTFLYVAIVEVGMKELLVCRHDDWPGGGVDGMAWRTEAAKLLAFALGFAGMSALAAFV